MRRHRQLLIDEMRDAGLAGLRHQCLAERFEGFALMGIEQPERNAAGPRLSGAHDDFDAPHRERQCAQSRAFDKAATANGRHRYLLPGVIYLFFFEGYMNVTSLLGSSSR